MTISASALRELHRIHKQQTDLRNRLERGPKQIRATEANQQRCNDEVAKAKDVFTKARIAADDKQLQLKQREDRITSLKTKLNTANSNKEFQALKEQIAADEQANSVLGDEILDALVTIDDLQEHVRTAETNLTRTNEEAEKTRKRVDAERDGLESELARVQDELIKAEEAMPPDFRAEYKRVSLSRGEDALAEIEGETCGSCHTMLAPQTMNELYLSKVVFCKSCGALLYLPEGRTVESRGDDETRNS